MRPTNRSTDNTFSKLFNNTACRTNKSRFSSSQTVSYIPVLILTHISYSLFHVWVLLPKCYQARSRSREECPCTFVTSVRLFAYISASPSGRICVTVVIEDFYVKKKNFRNPNFVENRTKISGTLHKNQRRFIVAGDIESTWKPPLRLNLYQTIRIAEKVKTLR